jgi:molybdopterin-guanine dinucleotide biosynthesis protein A
MGKDKAFIEFDGLPLWRRQLQLLCELGPHELFLSGPAHEEWRENDCIIVPDAQADAGPLAGLVATLRRCSAPLLVALAVDLPHMTAQHLSGLVALCSDDVGIIPRTGEDFEPVAAVYPRRSLRIAESCLATRSYSMQHFAERCVSEDLVTVRKVEPENESLFLNMNTPADLRALTNV